MMRTINSAHSPQWANFQQTEINVMVDFDELDENFVKFTATMSDSEEHGRYIYQQAIAGAYGEIGDFVPPSNLTGEMGMDALRHQRDLLLAETDYVEMPTRWATLTSDEQTAWTAYRNALRDLPATYPNAEKHWNDDYTACDTWVNVVWPTKPE